MELIYTGLLTNLESYLWVPFSAGAKHYFLLHSVQTGSGAHLQLVSEPIF
jgi:hypothetical protein